MATPEDIDNFGEFSAAFETASNGKHDPVQGDNFGACETSTPENNPQNGAGDIEAKDPKDQIAEAPADDNDDDRGNVGSLWTPTRITQEAKKGTTSGAANQHTDWASAPASTPKANASLESSSHGVGYENVAGQEVDEGPADNPVPFPATPRPPPIKESPAESDTGEFGGFSSTPEQMEGKPTGVLFRDLDEPEKIEIKPTEDPFGDFNGPARGTQDALPRVQAETTPGKPPADEQLGGFDGATTRERENLAELCANGALETPEDAHFCGVGGVDSSPVMEMDDVPALTHTPATTESTQHKDGDNCDLRGFDGDAVARIGDVLPPRTEKTIAFGEFGGCDSAPVAGTDDVPALTPATAEKLEDDDFGDFGGFGGAPTTVTDDASARTAAATTENLEDHDFGYIGEFGSAPGTRKNDAPATALAVATTEKPYDENFGDFGGFNSATAPGIENIPAASEVIHDDDFGDFDDFDSAPAATKAAPQQKQTTDPQTQPSRSGSFWPGGNFSAQIEQASSAAASDAVLKKAKTVFSSVFERFKLNHSSNGSGDSSETIEVAGLTASMEPQCHGTSSGKLMKDYRTILDEIQKEDHPPAFIITEGQVHCPNAHFSVPIDGESFCPNADTQWPDAALSQHRQVSTQLPAQPTAATMVQLPHQTSTGMKHVNVVVVPEKAQCLLRQTPNLSFMLQSKFLLPSNMK